MANRNPPRTTIKSDETLFSIMEHLHREGKSGVTEIADQVGVSKSTVHKHLITLEANNFATADNGVYGLSFKFLMIGGMIRERSMLCKVAIPIVEELGDKTDKMVSLIVREGSHGAFVHITNEWYGVRETVPLGNRHLLHQNAAGKAVLSQLSDDEVHEFVAETGIPAVTERTITDQDVLFQQLEGIRKRGFATSHEERVEGFQSVSAPISNPQTNTLGAISLATPADNVSDDSIRGEYADQVMEASNEVNLRLRYYTG